MRLISNILPSHVPEIFDLAQKQDKGNIAAPCRCSSGQGTWEWHVYCLAAVRRSARRRALHATITDKNTDDVEDTAIQLVVTVVTMQLEAEMGSRFIERDVAYERRSIMMTCTVNVRFQLDEHFMTVR